MKSYQFSLKTVFPTEAEKIFLWHLHPAVLERMTPPWIKLRVISQEGDPSQVDSKIHLQIKIGILWIPWILQYKQYKPKQSFTQVQIRGPFRCWNHHHEMSSISAKSSSLEDTITYSTFFTPLHHYVQRQLKRSFTWRHKTLMQDVTIYAKYPLKPMRILLSGSSGLVGHTLSSFLKLAGHEVVALRRKTNNAKAKSFVSWNPASGEFALSDFECFDAVIHLAGKNISSRRWTKKFKREIFLSRCRDTWLLSEIFLRVSRPPKTFICASAVGYYGPKGDSAVSEQSPYGSGFLADTSKKWEDATESIAKKMRVIHTRFGAILSPAGGILQKILPLFNLGLGVIFGDGKQYFPWIALEDVLYSIYHCLSDESISGSVNIVSPQLETFETFCQKLAKILHRPLFLRIPAPVLKIAFGEMAKEVFLPSIRAIPEKLIQSNYSFTFPDLDNALKHMLGLR